MSEVNNIPQVQEILIGCINPSPMNPRKTFNEDALRELAENIRQQGLLQPITVRHETYKDDEGNVHRIENSFEIVCGERRYRACKMISPIMYVPCIVRDLTDDEAFDAMITENLQRRDVDPIEEAVAFNLLAERGSKPADIAARFGKSLSYVRDRMRLCSLVEPLREAISSEQLPLRGAYLLARLSTEDQNDFVDDEFDGDVSGGLQLTYDDVTDWLDRHFMNLYRAPFQDGKTLKETWNPDGKMIRRCQTCDCNTNNHGCLFADMKTEEPQCIDRICFERKRDIYYDWFVNQYASRLTRKGNSIAPGDVILFEGDVWGDNGKKRLADLKEKYNLQGYRIFTDKELPNRYWGGDNAKLKEGLKDGKYVECIELRSIVNEYGVEISYRELPSSQYSNSAPADSHFMASRLAERAAATEKSAEKKITSVAKKTFNREEYTSRKGELEPWENTVLMAIVFYRLSACEGNSLIPGSYCSPTFQQMQDFLNRHVSDQRWKRKAIVEYIESAQSKSSMFSDVVSHLSIEVEDFANKTRQDAEKRIKEINDELREMGYDEKANKL